AVPVDERLLLDVLEVDDRCRTVAGLGRLRRTGRDFALPGMSPLPGFDPALGEPGDARAGKMRRLVEPAVAVREHVEPVRAGLERVRLALTSMDEAVAGSDCVGLPVLPRQARPVEDEEDLLRRSVHVSRCRPEAGLDLDPLDTDADRARRPPERAPGRAQMACRLAPSRHLVPVGDGHAPDYRARTAAVTAAARTTAESIGARRRRAPAAAATPASRASTTTCRPEASVCVTTSAAS